jgi:hypothetical protein
MEPDYANMSEEQLLQELRKLDDFEKYPLPISWYKKFNLPAPKTVSVPQYVKEASWIKCAYNPSTKWEVRTEPAPGGVRPVLETDLPTVELTDSKYQPFISEIVSESQQETQREREDSTANNNSSSQPVLGH